MNGQRPVDRAMGADRPDKHIIRQFWVEATRDAVEQYPEDDGPIYLTLSGAEGRDIRLLADSGLIRLTEAGAIAPEHQQRIVAVEGSLPAVLELQRHYPGLKILTAPIQSLVRGVGPTNWPAGEDQMFCRARVVNLDFNSSLSASEDDRKIVFPVFAWISKLGQLHAIQPRRDWTLCLTLQGEVRWDDPVRRYVQQFLAENFVREPRFGEACLQLLGEELHSRILGDELIDFSEWPAVAQQQLLMVLVPKAISHEVLRQGWKVQTAKNFRYGGGASAPMVTWVVRFVWEPDALATPDRAYREALTGILSAAGEVRENGQIIDESVAA